MAYILDEPSIGLHQRDNDKLLGALKNLKDLGNTLIVVEHDEDTMLAADYIVDIGPGRCAWWTSGGMRNSRRNHENKNSVTGAYLKLAESKYRFPQSAESRQVS